MLANLEEMQKAAKLQVEPLTRSTVEMMKGAQKMQSEAAEQVGKSVERFTVYYEKLCNAKGVDEAMRIHSAFAANNLEHMFSGVTKLVETCASVAKDASAPVSEAVKEANNAVTNIASRASEARGRAAGGSN
jgi:hypothetical protein